MAFLRLPAFARIHSIQEDHSERQVLLLSCSFCFDFGNEINWKLEFTHDNNEIQVSGFGTDLNLFVNVLQWGAIQLPKVPVITPENLDANSIYPQDGIIACEIVNTRKNQDGKIIVTVDASKPWGIDTIEGITQFDIFEEQLIELER